MLDYSKTCFVVMPFGKKPVDGHEIDFDSIYDTVFLPAIAGAVLPDGRKLEARRTDKDFSTADITVDMFRYLEYSRFVLCDITCLNPNVLYELGVRHRARQSGTVIFRQVEVKLPFDIAHIKAFPYEYQPEQNAEESRQLITKVLTESVREDRTDNIVQLAVRQEQQQPRPDVEELLKNAENALRKQDPAGAVAFLRKAVIANPDNAMTRMKLGIILKEEGKWPESLEQFKAAIEAAPDYADAYREKGVAEGKLKTEGQGEQSLHKAIELNPNDFDALASLGGILKRKGDFKAALEKYKESVRASNGHAYPLLNAMTIEAHLSGALDLDAYEIFLARAERARLLQVKCDPPYDPPWSFFDLAQIRLFNGDRQGFLDYLKQGILFSPADSGPRTFRETLELLPRGADVLPGLDEGIEKLKKSEAQLARSKAAP
ncbi:MAG TPA: tetratricopeptide repeat protein [Candidatus Angelobacter sp.]